VSPNPFQREMNETTQSVPKFEMCRSPDRHSAMVNKTIFAEKLCFACVVTGGVIETRQMLVISRPPTHYRDERRPVSIIFSPKLSAMRVSRSLPPDF